MSRFSDELTDKEAAFLGLALTCLLIDRVFGKVTGERAGPAELRDNLDTLVPILDDLSARFGITPIDPALLAMTRWKLDNEAEAEAQPSPREEPDV